MPLRPSLARRLRRIAVLEHVGVGALAGHTHPTVVAAGDVLIAQGRVNHHAYLIESGRLLVEIDGRPVSTVGPGDVVGELTAVEPGPATATVRALEAGTVFAVDHRLLVGVAEQQPRLRDRLAALIRARTGVDPAA